MTRDLARAWPGLAVVTVAGLAAGLASRRLAEMPDRWLVATLLGLSAAPIVLLSGRIARATLVVFVLSLQLGLSLYLTDPPAASSVGASWPNSLALPIGSLTGLVALVAARRRGWRWGGGLAGATALLLAATAASLVESPARMAGLAHLLVLAAYYIVFLAGANAVRDAEDLDLVRRLLGLTLVVQSVVYFAQSLLGATFSPTGEWMEIPEGELARPGGTVGMRPAAFSSFLLPLLLLAVSEFLTSKQPGSRWRGALLTAAGGGALALTFTRASWIGFALGLVYLMVAGWRRGWLRARRVAVVAVALLVVGLVLSPKILLRVSDDHASDLKERWSLVAMALRVIEAHPWTGVGAGAYPYVFREYLTPDLADRWLYVVHNVYVLRAAETGLPGLAAWLLFLAVAFRKASPERMSDPAAGRMALGWRAGLIALAWEMLWDVSLGPAANSLMWFLCGVMAAGERRSRLS